MKRNFIAIVLLGFLLALLPTDAMAQSAPLSMNVEGTAPIQKSDLARAREAAVQDALEKAITQASAKLLADKVQEEKYQALKSIILDASDKYVSYFQILTEKKSQEEYFVTLNVVVVLAALKSDFLEMGILQQEGQAVQSLLLYFRDAKTYADYARLKNHLLSRPKLVKSIYPVRLEWRQAVFEVQVFSDPELFIEELAKTGRYVIDVSRQNQTITEIFLRYP
ncbi:MAG: flagellar assembly protein T N-terminal domain-containing protein [Smithellaceae bacterium]